MAEKYSILMSVYHKDNPFWLAQSIDSMLAQTAQAEEFLLVEDGPLTPELNAVVEKYRGENPALFTVLPLEHNMGLGPALAHGIEKCRNELVIRMDADDISLPDRCEKLLAVIQEDPELGMVGSFGTEFEGSPDHKIAVHDVPVSPEDIAAAMRRRCSVIHPTVVYKKSAVLESGNYHDLRLYEDYDLFMRMVLEHGVKCRNIPESLYLIRTNEDFFARRGGLKYAKTVVSFKWRQFRKGYMGLSDFIISAGGHAVVCMLPNSARKWFYMKFLRK